MSPLGRRRFWITGACLAVMVLVVGLVTVLRPRASALSEAAAVAPAADEVIVRVREDDNGALPPGFRDDDGYHVPNEAATYMWELLLDSLVNRTTVGADGEPRYREALASGFAVGEADGREVLIELRAGVTWHDGRPFGAEDVLYTWRALHDSGAVLAPWLDSHVESLAAQDASHVRVRLRAPAFRETLYEVFSSFKILPARVRGLPMPTFLADGAAEPFRQAPVGTGRCRFGERAAGKVTLERNAAYGAIGAPVQFQRLVLATIPDDEAAARQLVAGDIHLIPGVSPRSYARFEATAARQVPVRPYGLYAIVYNTEAPPFDDVVTRRALNARTNKKALFTAFTGDSQDPAAFVSPGLFPPNSRHVLNHPDELAPTLPARSAPLPETSFTLLYSEAADGGARRLAEVYREQMAALGVTVTLSYEPRPSAFEAGVRQGRFQAALYHVRGLDHRHDFRGLFAENPFRLRDREIHALLDAYAAQPLLGEAKRLAVRIQRRVEELSPACFMFVPSRRAYRSPSLCGVAVHPEVGVANAEEWRLSRTGCTGDGARPAALVRATAAPPRTGHGRRPLAALLLGGLGLLGVGYAARQLLRPRPVEEEPTLTRVPIIILRPAPPPRSAGASERMPPAVDEPPPAANTWPSHEPFPPFADGKAVDRKSE